MDIFSSHRQAQIRILFYSVWVTGLILQALLTELTADEAYYWMYSRYPAWGYFDHPPVIAWLIRAGTFIFPGEIGVRLFPVLAATATLVVWEKIIRPVDLKVFYLLILSVGILHFTGFFATPDVALLLTASLYLLVYKEFIRKPGNLSSLLLGITGGLMVLSKYHGMIILGLTVLSCPVLLRNRYFWQAAAVLALSLIPHFIWQINEGFPSFKYHLFERNSQPYRTGFTFDYLLSQPFILGPLTGILFLISAWKIKNKNQFEKTLKYLFWGGYIFFLVMTFRGRIEGHWTLFIIIPAIYFGYLYLEGLRNRNRILYPVFGVSIVLIIAARILIVADPGMEHGSPVAKVLNRFHNKQRMKAIREVADTVPVAFMNSYQQASLYEFYSRSAGFSLNNIMGRKNQFNIWDTEEKYRGERVMLITNYDARGLDSIPGIPGSLKYTFIDNFQVYSRVRIIPLQLAPEFFASDTMEISLKLEVNGHDPVDFESNPEYPSHIFCQFFQGNKLIREERVDRISNDMIDSILNIRIITPSTPGKYDLCFSIGTGWLPPSINSNRYRIVVMQSR